MITIVDYGMGNLASIRNMLARIGQPAQTTDDVALIAEATKLILPGVGSFDAAVANIEGRGLRPVLDKKVLVERVPILGICLGMQLMTRSSEEGTASGLGWLPADTIRFDLTAHEKPHPIPHMGWNTVRPIRPHPLFTPSDTEHRFYFVHSYHVRCDREEDVLATTKYGDYFTSAFSHSNIIGVQFHPEKSHRYGMELLRNFSEWVAC